MTGSPIIHCAGWWPPERLRCTVDLGDAALPPADLATAVEMAWLGHLQRHPQDFDGLILHARAWWRDKEALVVRAVPMRFALLAARRSAALDAAERARIPGPLGLSVIPMGSDGRIVVSRRSSAVSVARGSLFFFGGFGEPPKMNGPLDLSGEAERELREELGGWLVIRRLGLLGIGEHPVGHLDMTFLAELDHPADAVIARAGSAADAGEWDRLAALDPPALMALTPAGLGARRSASAFDQGRWLLARHLGLPPPAASAFALSS